MLNRDAMYRQTLDRQQQLLDEAAGVRLLRAAGGALEAPIDRRWRATCATILRRVADRLEPAGRQSQVRA